MECPKNNMQKLVLIKGLEVEVRSNEKGFTGAWYKATIVKPPNKTRKKDAALIEYHKLVKENGSELLREYAKLVHIRPLPPSDSGNSPRRFEEDDVVDAFYNDGWWTGVLCRVLEGDKFLVYFDSPPDVMEFERASLRMHQEWLDGKWVLSQKHQKQQSTKSIFSSGQVVEVNFNDETSRDIWFTAIFIKYFEGSILVKYKSSQDDNEFGYLKVTVDTLHVRPIPPPCVDREYALLEEVEIFAEFGWRIGQITEVSADGKYTVSFKLSEESVKLDRTKLRPHMRWINGKWSSTSEIVTSTTKTNDKYIKMPKDLPAGKVGTGGADVVSLLCGNEVMTSESDPIICSMPGSEQATYQRKKRGRQKTLSITSYAPLETGNSSKTTVKRRLSCSNTKQHETATVGLSNTPTDENTPLSTMFGGVHSHVGTKMSRLPSHTKAEQHKEVPQAKAPSESCSTKNVSNKNPTLPFVKRSPAWKKLESMKVFETMPQKPHFHPLNTCAEEHREGNAIGKMFTFACTAEMVSNLKLDDPRSTFSSALESLLDLESHGFDVDPITARVDELLDLKDGVSLLQEEARVKETKITELTQDKMKVSDEREKMEMEIADLQKRLLLGKSREEKASDDIVRLRSGLEATNAVIHDAMLEFDMLSSLF